MTYHFNEVSTVAIDPVVETLVDQALAAQREIENWSEQRIDMLLHAMADVVAGHAHHLAVATVAETGMGNVRDKTLKNSLASVGVYQQLAGQVGLGEIGFDRDRRVAEIASPVGVIVGLVPATHPVATFVFKSLIAIKGRNAIIFSPSHRAQQVSQEVGRLIQKELIAHGAPVSLVQWIGTESTRETTTALMSHRHVALVLATGGRAMVKAAYRSGTPAIGVGPGNAPALISADADIRQAARSIVMSKSFDNGLICGAENHLVVEGSAHARLVAELVQNGAALLTESESARFRDAAVNPEAHRLMSSLAGHDAATLARLASIERPYDIQLAALRHPVTGYSDRVSGFRELPRCREARSGREPIHGRRYGRGNTSVSGVALHRRHRPHRDHPYTQCGSHATLHESDASQPRPGELPRHPRPDGFDDRSYPVDDPGVRNLGRHVHHQ